MNSFARVAEQIRLFGNQNHESGWCQYWHNLEVKYHLKTHRTPRKRLASRSPSHHINLAQLVSELDITP